jgi:cell wall-associated NlpC family hydrolase
MASSSSSGQLRPGDAVFFHWGTHPETGEQGPLHEGLYLGNGLFMQAPRTGDVVKISRLSDRDDFLGGRRYL